MTVQPELFGAVELDDQEVQAMAESRRRREEEMRRDVQRRMRAERRAWLDRMELELAKVYEYRVLAWRDESYVTADDARNLMRSYPMRFALPGGATNKTLGGLFAGKDWEPLDLDASGRAIAMHVSTTRGSHGNRIVRWRYVGPERLRS